LNATTNEAPPRRAALAWLEWIDRRPWTSTALLALLCAGPLFLTVQFFSDVRAGLTDLLPKDAPAVRALDALHQRLGTQGQLLIIAQSPRAAVNHAFFDELEGRLRARHIPEARSIQMGCRVECTWAREHALLIMPQDKFDRVMGDAERAIAHAKAAANPLYVDLGTDETPNWKTLEAQLEDEAKANDRFPSGYFESKDGTTVLGMVALRGSDVDIDPSERLLGAVQAEVAAMRARYPADLVVAYSGEVANLVEEHAAIMADLSLSSAIVFLLVGAVILLYFRSVRGLVAVLFGLAPGLIVTFAIGRLTTHHLNSNSAFLGSIIAGNGINYPLLFLAYYRGRPADEGRALAIYRAGTQALFGTLAAAATASAAYGGLAVATFKGFSQFGWIGGVGMLTTWVFTFVSMPIAISLIRPPRGGLAASRIQSAMAAFFQNSRRSLLAAGVFVALALTVAGAGVRFALRHGLYEMDLKALRNRDSLRSGAASWDERVNAILGVWRNPVGALVEAPEQREPLAHELKRVMVEGEGQVAERVETIETFAPDAREQERRLARLRKVKAQLDRIPDQIPDKVRPYLDLWLSPRLLQPVALAEVPEALRSGFTETDGRTDQVVALFPSLHIDYSDARNVMKFADRLRTVPLPAGAVVGGGFLFMADIVRLVTAEAPQIVLVVALLVALVLTPFFLRRPARIGLVVATVGAVAVLSQCAMLAAGVQINMLNFAAVPITIGVGADYAVNLLGAMDALRLDARRACARMGGAIFLCSLTTVIGYVSLVIAQSGALRSFGWAAVLGEVMAVATVLLVLPVVLAPAFAE